MNCPRCHAFVDPASGYCPQCLGEIEPEHEPVRAAAAEGARPPDAVAPPPVEPASFAERFPGQQACGTHPEFPIAGTCTRCGKFLCVRCAPALAEASGVRCTECEGREEKNLEGIGGWLILVAIGLVGNPIAMVVRAGSVFMVLARSESWTGTQLATGGVYVLGVFLALYQAFVAVQFFRKKRSLPLLITICYAVYPAFCLIRVIAESGTNDTLEGANVRTLVQAAVGALIWIPYFHQSKRVKATFVR